MKDILTDFYTCALKFLPTYSLKKTYKMIVEEGMKLFKADYGSIFIIKNNEFERVYSTVPKKIQIQPRRNGLLLKAFKSGTPYIMKREEIIKAHSEIQDKDMQMFILIPLIYHKEAIGMLSLDTYNNREFTQDELNTLKLFGSMASLSISKAKLYKEDKHIVQAYDSMLNKVVKENNSSTLTLDEFTNKLRNKLKVGDTPTFIWAEVLLWEIYQQIRAVRTTLPLTNI